MGIFTNFLKTDSDKLDAAISPYTFPDSPMAIWANGFNSGQTFVTRQEAMSVPAVSRARGIICGSIGSIRLETRRALDNSKIESASIIRNPDPRMPRSVVYAWTAEDILFNGVAYWQVMSLDEATGRPASAQWISAKRIIQDLDVTGTIVLGYQLDNEKLPASGVGSLIQFTGMDEGALNRGGRTIRTAVELEKAVYRFAQEPTPAVVLKSTLPLPKERVTALLDAWRQARQTRGTAFLNDSIDMTSVGFNSAELQLTEARQYLASEIARLMGIPEWYLGANAGGSMTYSNVTSERRALLDFSLRPIISSIEDRLSMDDVTVRGQYVSFDLDDFLRGNPLERAEIYSKLIPLGVMTVDEVRRDEEMVD
jgi:HK97 family phage portal protein